MEQRTTPIVIVQTLILLLYPYTPHCPLHKIKYIPFHVAIVNCTHVYHVEIQHIPYLVSIVDSTDAGSVITFFMDWVTVVLQLCCNLQSHKYGLVCAIIYDYIILFGVTRISSVISSICDSKNELLF